MCTKHLPKFFHLIPFQVNYYFAEFWNTLTNLAMIVPALKGIHNVYCQKFEPRFALLYLGLGITGIGSWMFHMSLLYEMQLFDELPMVWTSAYMVYCLYKVSKLVTLMCYFRLWIARFQSDKRQLYSFSVWLFIVICYIWIHVIESIEFKQID